MSSTNGEQVPISKDSAAVDPIVVRGVWFGASNPRQEINRWAINSPLQFSLFIRGLQRFYDQYEYADDRSFFRVGGIHGSPFGLSWNGAAPPANPWTEGPGQNFTLYCTHNMRIFPTWHRPYMALFEQLLWQNMLDALDELKPADGMLWLREARLWRLPYWDWALKGATLPSVLASSTVQIVSKDSKTLETVSNPLYRFQLKYRNQVIPMGYKPILGAYAVPDDPPTPIKDNATMPWSQCTGTSRYGVNQTASGTGYTGLEGVSNAGDVNAAIAVPAWYDPNGGSKPPFTYSIGDAMYRVFLLNGWDTFATTKYSKNNSTNWISYLSLEYVHNNLHNFIGGFDISPKGEGAGHMSDPAVAAFDPIFFMHHCNVDRQLAIWQTLQGPSQWFNDSSGSPSQTTPLTPFRKSTASPPDYLNSNDIQVWYKALNYDYDVLVPLPGETRGDPTYIGRIYTYINMTYNRTGQLLMDDSSKDFLAAPDATLPPELKEENAYPDYLIDIIYDRYALDGQSYSIHFFLGPVDDAELDSHQGSLLQHPHHVGVMYTFTGGAQCGNCNKQKAEDVLSTAQIAMTIKLLSQARDPDVDSIHHIDPASTEPHLRDNLTWRAYSISGERISMDRLPRTRIFVVQGVGKHYREPHRLSEYGQYKPVPSATSGKPRGAEEPHYDDPSDGL